MKKKELAEGRSSILDISKSQDLFFGLMNLASAEEHLEFTGVKTGNQDYFKIADELRKIRSKWLNKLVKNHDGEVYCCSKHLLNAVMRFLEVGIKATREGNEEEASELSKDAKSIFQIFWLLQKLGEKVEKVSGEGRLGGEDRR